MRIAFLSTFYPYRGGIAQFNGALFRALEKDHDIKAFNFSLQYPSFLFPGKTQYVTDNDKPDRIETVRVLNAVNPISYQSTLKKIQQFHPDLLLIGYWLPYMAPSLGYIAGKMQNHCEVISIVHNAIPHEKGKFDKLLSNYFFNRNSKIITLSEAVRNQIEGSYPKIRVNSFPHPVYNHFGDKIDRSQALNQLNLPENNRYILFFGLIRDYKGLDLLLESLSLLDKDIHLILAGEVYGSFEPYRKIMDKFSLKNRVHLFLEYIPDEEVKFFFSASECVVLPYKSGTQSGIIAISKHFNKPVVATNVGGLSEFITDEKQGVVVPEVNPSSIADGIRRMLAKNAKKETYNSAEGDYLSWNAFANKLIAFAKE
ncbi:MAG: glycosyltransferase [Brumimicrobium sp.]|nr:glycosyltransferase [Brumimicrobium sp.]